jgi:hypothetical protein
VPGQRFAAPRAPAGETDSGRPARTGPAVAAACAALERSGDAHAAARE